MKKHKEFVTALLDHQFLTTVFKTSDSNEDSTHGLVFSTEPLVNGNLGFFQTFGQIDDESLPGRSKSVNSDMASKRYLFLTGHSFSNICS